MPASHTLDRRWWKEAVVYQIYPCSFNDIDGDGIGDLPGITARLDYLKALGIDVVWLSPVYDSPLVDNGYDIRNYRAIAGVFGSMDDFDRMLAGMHERGIRCVMDLVVNHTSDEHRWFEQARQSRDNPYRDYYIWKDPGPDGGLPNNWPSFFGGPAWSFDEVTGQYYLHLFTPEQPDLNWENPAVRQEVCDMMRFWLEKGVDGFRMDAITFISKDPDFPDFPDFPEGADPFHFYANGPRIHEYLHEMNREVLRHYDAMTVGEGWGIAPKDALRYVGREREELQTLFHFDHVRLARRSDDPYAPREWTLPELKEVFATWDEALTGDGWGSLFLGNHDLPRMVSRYGDDRPAFRRRSAKMLLTFLLTMRGTPYIYQGDELGLPNPAFETLDDYCDIATLNDVREKLAAGADRDTVLRQHQMLSRDNARTPVPWDDSPNGGFTTADEPWIPVHPAYAELNARAAQNDEDSVYHYVQRLIRLRKTHAVLVYGAYEDLATEHEHAWVYRRTLGENRVLVLLNWSDTTVEVELPQDARGRYGSRWIGNYDDVSAESLGPPVVLRPYEAKVRAE